MLLAYFMPYFSENSTTKGTPYVKLKNLENMSMYNPQVTGIVSLAEIPYAFL